MSTREYTADFELQQPAGVLFPLFSPEGEKLWVPGWDYENVMDSKELHEDYVFMTKGHDHGAREAIWAVKRYEPDIHQVEFYRIEPGEKLGVVKVACHPAGPTATRVQVTYKYIGLSARGNEFIEAFTRQDYEEFIQEWHGLLTEYFAKKAENAREGYASTS